MTEFIQHYTLKYTPLSPIHIGTGDSYEPTNYVIKEQTLYEFDTGSSVAAFSEAERQELLRILSGRPERNMLSSVQKFFYDRRDAIIPFAINAVPVFEGIANFYDSRIGKIANQEKNGQNVINKLEIERCAYNPITRHPVLLGSSVKGAVRTALLDWLNNRKTLIRVTDRKTGKPRKENSQEMQQRLFGFRAGKFELDPMRLIHLSDAHWTANQTLPKTQICMTVNRKKQRVLDDNGKERPSQSENNKNLNKLLESVQPFHLRAFSATLNLQQTQNLSPALAGEKIPKQPFSLTDIAQACNAHYVPLLLQEMDLLEKRGFIDNTWQKNIQDLLASIKTDLEQGHAMIIRVGRHSGAEAVTLDGVRQIKIMTGKDPHTKKMRSSFEDKTKTLWLAAEYKEQRTGLRPFGWLLIEIQSGENPAFPENAVLQQICMEQLQTARQWADKQAEQKRQMQAEIERIKKRKEQERQQQIEKQQAEARQKQEALKKQQEEADRKAKLSPIEREIEEFLQPIQPQEHDTRLLKELETGRWEGDDARIVAEKVKALMEAAGKWKPEFSGTNPKKLKLKERSQKVLRYLA